MKDYRPFALFRDIRNVLVLQFKLFYKFKDHNTCIRLLDKEAKKVPNFNNKFMFKLNKKSVNRVYCTSSYGIHLCFVVVRLCSLKSRKNSTSKGNNKIQL